MLDYPEISDIIATVAKSTLGRDNVIRVLTEPALDSEGEAALRVTIVIEPDAVETLKGKALLENLVQIHRRLEGVGEERRPMVGFATEDELADSGDTES